jgi:deazaflavin-dependent oxidoreductase (nitroreductase family)
VHRTFDTTKGLGEWEHIPAKGDASVTEASHNARRSLEQSAGEPFAYLTTVGRRTGRPHRIEIWFAVENGSLYLLSGGRDRSHWVRNLQANPRVTVELGGETRAGIARAIGANTAEDRRARELLVEKYRSADDDLAEWGRASLPVAIEFSATDDHAGR